MEKIVGLDASVFIYLLERHPIYVARARSLLNDVQSGKYLGICSVIGLIEILTGPKKKQRYDLADMYHDYISQFPHLTIKNLTEEAVEVASTLWGQYNISTPDAIHLATAITCHANCFITNDKRLLKIKEIRVELL